MKIINIESENDVDEFEKVLKEMPAFVKIFSPSCGHCIAMAPAWEKLKKNADLNPLNFALVAINASATSNMKLSGVKNVEGVPTLRVLKQGSGALEKEYSGNRTAEEMTNFIIETFSKSKKTSQTGGSKKGRKSKSNSNSKSKSNSKSNSKSKSKKTKRTSKRKTKKSRKGKKSSH